MKPINKAAVDKQGSSGVWWRWPGFISLRRGNEEKAAPFEWRAAAAAWSEAIRLRYFLPFQGKKMAPALGFEPRTKWLTATYSTAELCRNNKMAEREGFEPSERFPPRRFSKPVLSATQPSLRLADVIRYHPIWIFQAVFALYCKKFHFFYWNF